MKEKSIEKKHHKTFEEIKYIGSDGQEFWMARQLSKILEYAEFRNFLPVIERAKKACKNSGQQIENHFVEMHEMITLGKGGKREMLSYALSRYACYLIVQNGDPSKPVIANGQTYFAIQTRRQELAANLFRATQAEEKLRRENIQGKSKANKTHFEVGKKVRRTIEELGGTMPEELPNPEEDLKKLEQRIKTNRKKMIDNTELLNKKENGEGI